MFRTINARNDYYLTYNPLCDNSLLINKKFSNPTLSSITDQYTPYFCIFGNTFWPIHKWIYEMQEMIPARIDKLVPILEYMGPDTAVYFLTWFYSGIYPVIPFANEENIRPIHFMPLVNRLLSIEEIPIEREIVITSHLIMLSFIFSEYTSIYSYPLYHNILLLGEMFKLILPQSSIYNVWTTIHNDFTNILSLIDDPHIMDHESGTFYERMQSAFYAIRETLHYSASEMKDIIQDEMYERIIEYSNSMPLDYNSDYEILYSAAIISLFWSREERLPYVNTLPSRLLTYYSKYIHPSSPFYGQNGDCILFQKNGNTYDVVGYCDASLIYMKCPYSRGKIEPFQSNDENFSFIKYQLILPEGFGRRIDPSIWTYLLFYYYTGIINDYTDDMGLSIIFSSDEFKTSLKKFFSGLSDGNNRNKAWEFGFINPLLSYVTHY